MINSSNNKPTKNFKPPVNLKKNMYERRIQRLDNFAEQQKALGHSVDNSKIKERLESKWKKESAKELIPESVTNPMAEQKAKEVKEAAGVKGPAQIQKQTTQNIKKEDLIKKNPPQVLHW